MSTATVGSSSVSKDLIYSLVLFACSAKLWLTLTDNQSRRSRSPSVSWDDGNEVDEEGGEDQRKPPMRPRFKNKNNDADQNKYRTKGGDNNTGNIVNNTRSYQDSGDEIRGRERSDSLASNGSNGMGKRRMSEQKRLSLMDRISHFDAVLTREASFDFHPRNSNWSHFENYAPSFSSSPPTPRKNKQKRRDISDKEQEEEGDFLWSEPPPINEEFTDDDDDDEIAGSIDDSLQRRRSHYSRRSSTEDILAFNSTCLPSKLIMVRHGQSEGNIDETLYATKADNAMRLTKLGWDMARMAGKALRDQLPPNESVHFIVSPYARTVETFHGIVAAWCDPEVEFGHIKERSRRLKMWYTRLMEMGLTWHEDPRIREQDFGNFQDPGVIKTAKSERHKFGSFYYRFPHGESASDVFDRVSTFLDSLWRSFESGRAQNYVLVAHGISIRVFLARYFRYSIDQFHMLANPKNCEMVVLAHDGLGRLKLDGRCELELKKMVEKEGERKKEEGEGANNTTSDGDKVKHEVTQKSGPKVTTVVTGYKKHPRLRTLPPQWVRPRMPRMCYNDN